MPEPRKTVFVSYAHRDRRWADELVRFMAPWIREQRLRLWDDSQIAAGSGWRGEIDRAMDEASVAVLLVTPSFLASDFIMDTEVPRLLERAAKNQLRIMWIAVEHSGVDATPLAGIQAVNDPTRPLDTLPRPERNQVLVRIAREIADAATLGTFASGLRIIDDTTEPLEAALEGRPEQPDREFRVKAHLDAAENRISFTGAYEVITAEDLEKLPDKDREFIAELEDGLERNYRRWSAVRKELGDAGGALDDEVRRQLARIANLMCDDLNAILDFLRIMHKGQLEDHYSRYRFICERMRNP